MHVELKTEIQKPGQGSEVLSGRDIIIIGLQPWYFPIGSNCKNIARYFSHSNRVLYINLPLNRKTFYLRDPKDASYHHYKILKNKEKRLKKISMNMWEYYPSRIIESINKIPFTNVFNAINYINNKRFAKDIREAINELGFQNFIVFNDNDFFNGFYLKELLSPSVYVYYSRDFLQGYKFFRKHGTVLEPQLIKKADIVVTNSYFLTNYCSKFNKNSYYIGQGCDLSLFDFNKSREMPDELKQLNYPLIGYVGALNAERLDIKLLEYIATEKPEWNIVLVGPEDSSFKKSKLHRMPNVIFTGKRPIEKLADYIKAFHVCINPQLLNSITEANYPLKIDEYLSMGKPVVATRTNTMDLFQEYTFLATCNEEYITLIEKALTENNETREQQRIAFAKTHTWEQCINSLYRVINQLPINS